MIQSLTPAPAPHQPVVDDREARDMALVLLRKYGSRALDVASDFAAEHRAIKDLARAKAWDLVCAALAATRTLS